MAGDVRQLNHADFHTQGIKEFLGIFRPQEGIADFHQCPLGVEGADKGQAVIALQNEAQISDLSAGEAKIALLKNGMGHHVPFFPQAERQRKLRKGKK